MSNVPHDLYYTNTHEWLRIEGTTVTIGITDHAQNELGDLVYVQLPDVQQKVEQGGDMVVVESVKAAADVCSPLEGTVIEVNNELDNAPESVNDNPYQAWLVKLEVAQEVDLTQLLTAEAYQNLL